MERVGEELADSEGVGREWLGEQRYTTAGRHGWFVSVSFGFRLMVRQLVVGTDGR